MKKSVLLLFLLVCMLPVVFSQSAEQVNVCRDFNDYLKGHTTQVIQRIDSSEAEFQGHVDNVRADILGNIVQVIQSESRKFVIYQLIGIFGIVFLSNGIFGYLVYRKQREVLTSLYSAMKNNGDGSRDNDNLRPQVTPPKIPVPKPQSTVVTPKQPTKTLSEEEIRQRIIEKEKEMRRIELNNQLKQLQEQLNDFDSNDGKQ